MMRDGVLAPFWEEAIFRGLPLPALASQLPIWAAAALSSLWFMLEHPGPLFFRLHAFFGGAVLSAVYLRTGNLLPAMVLHALYNLRVECVLLLAWTLAWAQQRMRRQ